MERISFNPNKKTLPNILPKKTLPNIIVCMKLSPTFNSWNEKKRNLMQLGHICLGFDSIFGNCVRLETKTYITNTVSSKLDLI